MPIKNFSDLQKHREDIINLASKYGITNIRVFGSVARGDAHEDSDIDLLVTLPQKIGLLKLSGAELSLEDALKQKVQLISDEGLSPYISNHIINEARPI